MKFWSGFGAGVSAETAAVLSEVVSEEEVADAMEELPPELFEQELADIIIVSDNANITIFFIFITSKC
jgi:hypothetical protein